MLIKTHFRLFLLLCAFKGSSLYALGEYTELYDAPQALAMGNAMTADATGYLSLFYNPAGLAKMEGKEKEYMIFDWDTLGSFATLGQTLSHRSLGIYKSIPLAQQNPGDYQFLRFQLLSGFSMRSFGFAVLVNHRYAGESDGTNIGLDAGIDLIPTVGFAYNFAGNLVKLGVAAKAIIRNELKGDFAHTSLSNSDAIAQQFKEGIGFGADVGLLVTLPYRFLPTLGVVWKDVMDTRFQSESHILNGKASGGKPDKISQSANAAFSIHPYFNRGLRATFSAEIRHIEKVDWPLRRRLHIGFQLEDEKSFYLWAGLNQLYLTAGLGLRLRGGNLELGTYGQDIGEGSETEQDRRFFMRYTVSF